MKPIQNNTKADVLIIHTGALGDVICSLTAIECLFSQKTIDFCCQGHIGPLIKNIPGVRNFFDINHSMMTSVFLKSMNPQTENWLREYPLILLLSFSNDWENCLHNYNCNVVRIPPRPPVDEIVHTTQFVMDMMQSRKLIFRNNSSIQDFILQKINRFNKIVNNTKWKTVSLHPGSGSSFKNWPIEKYVSLSQELKLKKYTVGWVLGPAENALMNVLIQHNVNRNDILQTNCIQIIMRYLSQSDHFVGNDSGISHLAAYLGIHSTVIFGPSDFRRWRPLGVCVKTIPDDTPVCSPCFENGVRQCQHKKCLEDITVSHVIEKMEL